MKLIEKKEIKGIYDLKHRHDDYPKGYDYLNNILKDSLSPFIYENSNISGFLGKLEPMIANLFDNVNLLRNWKNWYVDKYKNDHIK